jgi:cytochrome b561
VTLTKDQQALAAVLIFRIVWKLTNTAVAPADGVAALEAKVARIVHGAFYFILCVLVTSGYLISTADNSPISVFDFFDVPATITGLPEQEDRAGLIHEYTAYLLTALVVMHALAALKHHFINRDNTLRRMLGMALSGKSKPRGR